jgi:hypothetical protein
MHLIHCCYVCASACLTLLATETQYTGEGHELVPKKSCRDLYLGMFLFSHILHLLSIELLSQMEKNKNVCCFLEARTL